jgi:hypothetical protein
MKASSATLGTFPSNGYMFPAGSPFVVPVIGG